MRRNAFISAETPDGERIKAWVPVYTISDMTAYRLGGKQPEAWARWCVSNNTIFQWDSEKKGWVRCFGEIKLIEGVEFPEPVACEEGQNDDAGCEEDGEDALLHQTRV